MKLKSTLLLVLVSCIFQSLYAQTSWKGTVSTNWKTSSNWTAGVPNATLDAIVGDANFTGPYQPILTGSTASCRTLSIGTGSVTAALTIDKNINFYGDVIIGSNGSILQTTNNRTITLRGNWVNSGTYISTGNSTYVTFSGTAQTVTGVTAFNNVAINSGSTVTLASNISIATVMSISGTLDPVTYAVSGTGGMSVNSGGKINVNTTNFTGNYSLSGSISLSGASTVNYASASINQNISAAFSYGYLRINGGTTKFLTANLPALNSSSYSYGRIYIDAGTLDMQSFTANRGTTQAGGYFIMAIGTTLKIGGTNSFPANFNSVTIASNSTVIYYGNNQTISKYSYGNLIFESTSGVAVKTMPVIAMTIAGDFICQAGAGSGVTFTAGANLTVNLNVSLDAATTFNASTFTHIFKGSWTNAGILNGNTSTITFTGINAVLSGAGSNNFYNLTVSGAGMTAAGTTAITVAGNLATSGSGALTHGTNGTITLSGAAKTIVGNGFTFYNCLITGSVTTVANFTAAGNFTVNGTFAASAGTAKLNGASKTIAGSGTITFYSLNITGTISTAISYTMLRDLTVVTAASFTASNGTSTFNGTSTLGGIANLYNVTVIAAKSLTLGTNSMMGIAGTFTMSGTFNATSYIPNTVTYNSPGAQTIVSASYNNLVLANGGTKTPAGNLTVNNDLTIATGVTFNASSYTISLYRHYTNNGTFTAGTSSFQLRGSNNSTLTGSTTFYNLTVNKTSASIAVVLAHSMTTGSLTMTLGKMLTGSNSVTITTTRTGNGIIIGTITHAHAFAALTPYYFEGPYNSVTFTLPVLISSVTVVVIPGTIVDFDPSRECVNREYQVTVTGGTYVGASFSYHYEDNELNAFAEPFLAMYKYNSGVIWDSLGYASRNTTSNYITYGGLVNLNGRYSASGVRNIVRWNGSVSSAWENAANWTTISGASMLNRVPTSTDAAEIGQAAFTNQPSINSTQQIGLMKFGSVQPATVTISSGSLDNLGSIRGSWGTSAAHTLNVGSGTLTVGTTMVLSDGIAGHTITLGIGSGAANIVSEFAQPGGAVTFSGNGTLNLSGDYTYTAGTFTGGTGTVVYSGTESQTVAPVTYNNLSFTKSTDVATIGALTTVNGNFTTATGGEIIANAGLTVLGNVTIGAGTSLIENSVNISVGGNWTTNGLFTTTNGTVNFNGTGAQTVNATIFNEVAVNKSSGTLTLTGNISIDDDLNIIAGTLDLSTFTANRTNVGGTLTLGASCLLKTAGPNNFPQNFITKNLDATSTVEYNGAVAQTVTDLDYGNLVFSNGGATAKTFIGNTNVNGNLTINTNATIDPNFSTITLGGNFTNSGTYTPSGSTLLLTGTSKTITGSTTFYSLDVTGSYVVASGTTTIAGDLSVLTAASLSFGSNNVSLDGDLTVNGSLTSNGVATFTGTRVQTFQIVNAISSSSTGVINFDGTVAPVLNSNTSPTFATLNINNTAGITPSVPWTVYFACNIAAGASFNGGALTHTFYGNFTNNGTVTSSGELRFTPTPPFSAAAAIKLDGVSFVSTGKVIFGGTSPITITDVNPNFNQVSVTNTNVAGITPPNAWTINDELYIANGATFNGGTALSHTLVGNLTNNGTLNGQTSTITFTGNPAEINGLGTNNFYNLTVAASADLTLNRGFFISRNFVNDGLFTAGGRSVVFNGSTASVISGAAGTVAFDNLEQNKTAGTTTLSIPVTVSDNLVLTSGIINTTSTNLLTLNDNAESTPGNSTSFVDGPMKKIGNDTFTFPLGDGTYWARLGIDAPALATDAYTAQYFAVPFSNTTAMAVSPSPVLNNVSGIEYWTCSRTTGTSNVKVKLYWESIARSVIGNYSTDLVVARWNGSAWENNGQSALTTFSPGNVTSNVVTSFTTFSFGSLSGGNVLPIELISFNANLNHDNNVDLSWSTATETNNDYFTIEKTKDGITFETVAIVDGAGNSTQTLRYSTVDNDPYQGVSYYRLKQTDFNGMYSYSNVIAVTVGNAPVVSFNVYPNPGNGTDMNIAMQVTEGQEIVVTISDAMGKTCYSETINAETNGDVAYRITPPQQLSRGIYFVSVATQEKMVAQKMIVE